MRPNMFPHHMKGAKLSPNHQRLGARTCPGRKLVMMGYPSQDRGYYSCFGLSGAQGRTQQPSHSSAIAVPHRPYHRCGNVRFISRMALELGKIITNQTQPMQPLARLVLGNTRSVFSGWTAPRRAALLG